MKSRLNFRFSLRRFSQIIRRITSENIDCDSGVEWVALKIASRVGSANNQVQVKLLIKLFLIKEATNSSAVNCGDTSERWAEFSAWVGNNWGFKEAPTFNYISARVRLQLMLKIEAHEWIKFEQNKVIVTDKLWSCNGRLDVQQCWCFTITNTHRRTH